jgi:O-antigen/teichoic acid export membrane protein
MHWFIIVCVLIFVVISINLPTLKYILRQEIFRTGLEVVPVLLLANLFLGIYYNLSVWYKLTDKTYFGTILTVIGAIITLLSLFILIPKIGYLGAAYATLICYASIAFISYYFGNKHFPVPYKTGSAMMYILSGCILVYCQRFIKIENEVLNVIVSNCLIIPFIGLAFVNEKLIKK